MLNKPNNDLRFNSYRGDCTKSIEQVLIQDNVN